MNEINKRILQIADYYSVIKPADFAKKTGFSHQVASNYLKGTRIPTADALCAIKQTFDISADWLLNGEGEMLCNTSNKCKHPIGNDVGATDATILYSIIQDLQRKNEELQRELGRKEVKIEYLEDEIKKHKENNAEYVYAHDIANVG